MIFTFSGFGQNTDPFAAISNVSFQYGTSQTEPHYSGTCITNCNTVTITENPVPEPASLVLVGSSILGFAARRRRSRKSAQ